MNLSAVAQIAQIVAPTVVAAGVIIGIVQLREFQRQRRLTAAVEIVNSFRTAEFNHALRIMWSLPDDLAPDELRRRGAEYEDAAVLVGTTVESVGVLVHRRIVPIDILDDLMGDAIVIFWKKLRPWVLELRRDQRRESVYEWFQWAVEQLEKRERRAAVGAHVKYKSWQP